MVKEFEIFSREAPRPREVRVDADASERDLRLALIRLITRIDPIALIGTTSKKVLQETVVRGEYPGYEFGEREAGQLFTLLHEALKNLDDNDDDATHQTLNQAYRFAHALFRYHHHKPKEQPTALHESATQHAAGLMDLGVPTDTALKRGAQESQTHDKDMKARWEAAPIDERARMQYALTALFPEIDIESPAQKIKAAAAELKEVDKTRKAA